MQGLSHDNGMYNVCGLPLQLWFNNPSQLRHPLWLSTSCPAVHAFYFRGMCKLSLAGFEVLMTDMISPGDNRLAFFAVSNNVVILWVAHHHASSSPGLTVYVRSLRAMISQFVFFIGIAAICFSGLLFTLWTLGEILAFSSHNHHLACLRTQEKMNLSTHGHSNP